MHELYLGKKKVYNKKKEKYKLYRLGPKQLPNVFEYESNLFTFAIDLSLYIVSWPATAFLTVKLFLSFSTQPLLPDPTLLLWPLPFCTQLHRIIKILLIKVTEKTSLLPI